MIVDSSALVAVALREPGHEKILDAALSAPRLGVGSPTVVETAIVLETRLGPDARPLLDLLMLELGLTIVPFEASHYVEAREAFVRFGRGRHAAGLNFGDCLTYAVAKLAGAPLLFMGDDFSQTDLESALGDF